MNSSPPSRQRTTADVIELFHFSRVILQIAADHFTPQTKSQGKSIQYHGQIDKEKGAELYEFFCDGIRAEVYELLVSGTKDPDYVAWKQQRDQLMAQSLDPRLPPSQVFLLSNYGSFDDTGFPLTSVTGEELSKGVVKKLRKQYDSHAKRHQKWLATHTDAIMEWDQLLPVGCVLSGSFGKRQGLELQSDMGPFCHVMSIP